MPRLVTFHHPATFVPFSEEDGILATSGAEWFASLLHRVPDLKVERQLCQEDWGVVLFASRGGMKFCIGLSSEGDNLWRAHFLHGPYAFLQRFTRSGRMGLRRLEADVGKVLQDDADVTEIVWSDM